MRVQRWKVIDCPHAEAACLVCDGKYRVLARRERDFLLIRSLPRGWRG